MKKIALLILTILGISFAYPVDNGSRKALNDTGYSQSLRCLLPDSLMQILEDRPFLLYWYGHHGHMWSLIYREDSTYRICIGTTRERNLYRCEEIDTIALLSDYNNLINWGMDSLPILARNMTPCYSENSTWLNHSLDVYHSEREIFASKNAKYSGPESIAFNNELSELSYLMWWLSDPSIRPYLPGFEKYSNFEGRGQD